MKYDNIINSCKYLLHNFPECEPHLFYLKNRLNDDSINFFNFGYFPNSDKIDLLITLSNNNLKDINLSYTKDIDDYKNHNIVNFSFFENHPLILPYKDTYGNIIAIVGRTILSESERKLLKIPKYKNTEFKKGNYLFGLFEGKKDIIDNDFVYIVEGQFDVIKAHEKGIKNIVALGNSNMTLYQFSIIKRYTNNLYLLLDNDEAGEKGRDKINSIFDLISIGLIIISFSSMATLVPKSLTRGFVIFKLPLAYIK